MLSPDTILQQRYRIVRQLGQGGMGAVYEAVDERLDTIVALKETLFADERLRKQFEREARLLARLHHQALPRVSDHFVEGDGQFLVMQYIAGEDLAAMLQARQTAFPPADVLRWADQLCDALDYLHTQDPQIIHRDIKPQNLKLTARGQVVLLDFGLAKGSAGQMSVVTTSASIFGYTPNYAPLEQVQGLGTDARSDIYSLAATLYHLVTNLKPPDALSRAAAIINGESDPLLPADRVATQVSPAIASVLKKGMAQNRAERFTSAAEMRETLRTAALNPAGEAATVLAGSVAASAEARTVSPPERTAVAGSSTRTEGSEAQTLVAADGTNVRRTSPPPETITVVRSAQAKRNARPWLVAVIVLLLAGGAAGFYAYRARKNSAQQTQNAAAVNPTPRAQASTDTGEVSHGATSPASSPQIENKKPIQNEAQKNTRTETTNERAAATKTRAKPSPEQSDIRKKTGDTPAHENQKAAEREREQNPPQTPVTPPYDPFRNQPGHPPGTNQLPNVRTLPNGTKVITQPDGTRIVVMPNGSTRVFPPDTKINRRLRRNP